MASLPRRLMDQFRKAVAPAEAKQLSEEISPVGAIHARPPFEGHIAWGINPQRLGAIMKAAANGSA
jgi:hypothetical protein